MVRRLGFRAFVLVVLAVAFFAVSHVQAGGFGCGSYMWSNPYPADLTDLYKVGAIPLPPYFALHPPVYYDMPVPRSYGYGPWAYPPYVETPEIVDEPTPEIIQNKYVPKPVNQESKAPKMASAPKLIRNPYVSQTESALAKK